MSDLFITTQGKGDVHVKKMECDVCKVRTERGDCLLHSVKVGAVSIYGYALICLHNCMLSVVSPLKYVTRKQGFSIFVITYI